MMKSISQMIGLAIAKASAQVTGSGTGSLILDVKDYKSVAFVIYPTAVAAADADNTMAFTVQEGDSALGYDMADVQSDRYHDSYTCDSTSDANTVHKVGVSVGNKRYMRLKWTETGTVDMTFSSIAILGGPAEAPVN